jgi:hypothetical protein
LEAERQLEEERKRKLEELERARLLEKQLREKYEREQAAIKIQSSYRGYRDRKEVDELRKQRHEDLRRQ